MSIGYLKKKTHTKARKGISPVIATVILVAVAVVIAAALAGFAGSLFGSYSNGPQVKVVTMTLHEDGSIDLVMANAGNANDAVTKVSVNGFGDTGLIADATVPANTNPVTLDQIGTLSGGPDPLTLGQQVTAVITMQSGSTITQTVNVIA